MKTKWSLTCVMALFITNSFSQVGIGTTNPQETLHVNGTIRVDNTTSNSANSTKILGLDANGTMNEILIGSNLNLASGTLSASSSGTPAGSTYYGVAIVSGNFANQTFNNYNLNLGGTNANKSVFILRQSSGSAQTVTFTGISGGTDGRVITIKTDTPNFNIVLRSQDTGSLGRNRFKLSGNETVNAYGSFTLVYVAADNRWHMINQDI